MLCTALRWVAPVSGLLGVPMWALGIAGSLSAADPAGIWVGAAESGSAKAGVFLSLVREGPEILGTLSTSAEPSGSALENVRLQGDELSFEIHDASDRTVKYRLHVADGSMIGQASAGDEVIAVKLAPAPSIRSYPAIIGLTSAPVPIHTVQPEYTKEARAALLEGTVELRVWIGPDGQVSPQRIRVLHGLGMGLDAQAIEAVKQWRLTPAYRNGKPVPVPVTIAVSFRLFQ